MNRFATHGALLADRLKKRPHTYAQMYAIGVSTSPHKRVLEWLKFHPEWRLDKPKNRQGLVQWYVVRAA